MAWILYVLGWWLAVSLWSLAGLMTIFVFDWFTTRRLPFARWRVTMSRDPSSRALFIREVLRLRPIRGHTGRNSEPTREKASTAELF